MIFAAAMLFGAQALVVPPAPPIHATSEVDPEFQVWGGPFDGIPSASDARAVYPLKLRAATSSIAFNCVVGGHGTLTNCTVRVADPELPRPKAAAVKLLRYFRVPNSPGSEITLAMEFSGKVWRCLMPFCMPELIPPPPSPPAGVCVPPVTPDDGQPCPTKSQTH
jgi:hypothetical protein